MKTNKCYVYFAIDGDDFHPDDITKILNINPTNIRVKGSRIPGKVPAYNSWQLSTETVQHEIIDVEAMALSVINKLLPKIDLINQIKQKYNASTRLEVVLWVTTDDNQSTPAVGFNVRIMDFLVKVGAFIDVDMYRS